MPDTTVRIPDWANPQNASVLDNWFTRALRAAGGVLGAADPTAQAMALGAPVELPGGEAGPAQKLTQRMLKAYHGSPHDFDQFSLSKVGAGEGGQAYGHGLYFAENPAVAAEYKKALEGRRIPENVGAKYGIEDKEAKDQIAKWQQYKQINPSEMHLYRADPPKTPADFIRNDVIDGVYDGKTYEVNLHASPDELLDWDKPLSQQSPKVQEALKKVGIAPDPNSFKWTAHEITDADVAAKTFGPSARAGQWTTVMYDSAGRVVSHSGGLHGTQATAAQNAIARTAVNAPKGDTGEALYTNLVAQSGGRTGHTEGIASQKLKDAGIKGIQYLDQGSRNPNPRWIVKHPQGGINEFADEASAKAYVQRYPEHTLTPPPPQTKNFVIFDDKIIEIAKKYGIALPAAAEIYRRQQQQIQGQSVNK